MGWRATVAAIAGAGVALPAAAAGTGAGDLQATVLAVFLAAAAFIAAVFVWVARSTAAPREADTRAAYRLRRVFFFSLTALAVIVIAFTLPRSPYALGGAAPERVVYVTSQRFGFTFTAEPVTTLEGLGDAQPIAALELPAGAMVEFRVTSLDVNHGFGVYDADGVLLGQTQAMPGYVNRLRLRLEQPGRYEVLCLEYCGMAHHVMRTAFTVGAAATDVRG